MGSHPLFTGVKFRGGPSSAVLVGLPCATKSMTVPMGLDHAAISSTAFTNSSHARTVFNGFTMGRRLWSSLCVHQNATSPVPHKEFITRISDCALRSIYLKLLIETVASIDEDTRHSGRTVSPCDYSFLAIPRRLGLCGKSFGARIVSRGASLILYFLCLIMNHPRMSFSR